MTCWIKYKRFGCDKQEGPLEFETREEMMKFWKHPDIDPNMTSNPKTDAEEARKKKGAK